MAKVWCDYHPDMGAEKYLWYTAAAVPPIAMGYLRVRALAHFPSDDAVGFMLGAAVGIIIPEFHKLRTKNISLGLLTSPDETGLSIRWALTPHEPAAVRNLAPGSM
jgi:membrane-associated phospholipid phosphatase